MTLCEFKDQIFEALNETDDMEIVDIELNDKRNLFEIKMSDTSCFEVLCRRVDIKNKAR